MTPIAEQRKYNLVFQAHGKDKPATVTCYEIPSTVPMPALRFGKDDLINIQVLGADGTSASMQSVDIKFTPRPGTRLLSPLGDGTRFHYLWEAGEEHTHTVNSDGDWSFSAELRDKDNQPYPLPDPEFQVGDGVSSPDLLRSA